MKKALSIFAFVIFACSSVFSQTGSEARISDFKEFKLSEKNRSGVKFDAAKAQQNPDLKAYVFKSKSASFLFYIGKDKKIAYAGSQGNEGQMTTQTIGGFLECCSSGLYGGGDPATVVISCAKEHLGIVLILN